MTRGTSPNQGGAGKGEPEGSPSLPVLTGRRDRRGFISPNPRRISPINLWHDRDSSRELRVQEQTVAEPGHARVTVYTRVPDQVDTQWRNVYRQLKGTNARMRAKSGR